MRAICDWSQVPLVFDVSYAALLLDTEEAALRYNVRIGNIPGFKYGKKWMFSKDTFKKWIQGEKLTDGTDTSKMGKDDNR